jgi:23S rRNA (cytidine1920-2'-O)/16S rRNA (cytidine1409-2'-O)-methyltransferase
VHPEPHAERAARSKRRLDALLVERGLAVSRSQAQALVLAGLVRGHSKPGEQVEEDAELHVERPSRFVSRGGEKLRNALDLLGVDVARRDCADVGASTGGFTDCLLQAGAARVIAIDVGYGQLHPKLRADPRVTVLERTNARTLGEVPFPPDLVVCDVSFISVTKALPPVLRLAVHGWEALVLVKPQFEAGRAEVGRGVVRDPEVQRKVLERVIEAAHAWGGVTAGVVDSGLPGPKGNREFFVHLVNRAGASNPDDIHRWIAEAVG